MREHDAIVRTTKGVYVVNHDRFLVHPDVPIYAVLDADMHQGHGADVVLAELGPWWSSLHDATAQGSQQAAEVLAAAVSAANAALYLEAQKPQWLTCGSTLTCCTLTDDEIVIAHIGDSRMYVRRGGLWTRVTTDHTLVEQLRTHGTPEQLAEEKRTHPNVLTRALGFVQDVEVDMVVVSRTSVDCLLLCTDGAWYPFDRDMAGAGPDGPSDLRSLMNWIFERHQLAGGRTNATAMLVPI